MNSPLHDTPDPVWAAIGDALDRHHRFLVSTHVHPDGDGLGAELGLWSYLRGRGKDVRIVNADPILDRFAFLDGDGRFEVYDAAAHAEVIADREVAILVDLSSWDRLGSLAAPIRGSGATTICIDHHPFEGDGPADLNGIDITAAATGQLVFELIRGRGHALDLDAATGLYVSILTDTGSFRFSNSDSRAHRAAAELLDHGIRPNVLYEHVFGNWTLGRLHLLGVVLSGMRTVDGGRLILLPVSREAIVTSGAESTDAEGFVDVARSAAPCEVVVLLLERPDGTVKVSLRSKGRVDVSSVARGFGGGGHIYASGAEIDGPLGDAADRVAAAITDAMDGDAIAVAGA